MKKNNKGFTLVELLAVIVILGLLMAIAIPSVTKYITQSRKKTLIKTIDSYITAVVTDVNDGQYRFSDSSKIFAIPIECIALEKGGSDPFGEWMNANKNYWAYVLVHYDANNYSYEYGFTFKDDAGYSMYPTEHSLLDGTYINNGLEVEKPRGGDATSLYSLDEWNGFDIDNTTTLNVLRSSDDGETGDGYNTCTLQQKGDNYEQIKEEEKNKTLVKYSEGNYFWAYSEQIKTVTFEDNINVPEDAYKSWDVSDSGNGGVMAYIKNNVSNASYYDLHIQANGEIYANADSHYFFYNFRNLDSINNIDLLNTSKITNMFGMFYYTGYNSTIFTLDLGNNFDTSNVTNMRYMFNQTGYSNTKFTLDLGDKFYTSKVTDMSAMFYNAGYSSTVFTLDLGNKFDTSKVTNMYTMFMNVGRNSTKFTLDLGSKFDTSKVTDMGHMFYGTGRECSIFTLNLGNKFNTANVTNMSNMFQDTGHSNTVFTLDLGDKFDTSKVTNMSNMFNSTGMKSSVFKLDCSNWNVNKVTSYVGFNAAVTTKVIPPTWKN